MNKQIESKQLRVFSIIAFGLPVIMGLFMWYGYSTKRSIDLFTLTHMYYPAAGAMIALYLSRKNRQLMPKAFFIGYLIQTGLMIVCSLLGLFIGNSTFMMIGSFVMILGSIFLWIALLVARTERREAYGLRRKNWKLTIAFVLLFVVLYIARMVIYYLIEGGLGGMTENFSKSQTWFALIQTLISYLIMFGPYFGEEYGWRYFLQPILQKRYGMIKGVLLLGIVWGLWHLPLNFFFYTSPAIGIISVANQIVVCITMGIFMGFVYMKTDNIWSVVAIHFLNNNLAPIFSGDLTGESMSGYTIGWSDVATAAVIMSLCYAWPIITKYFRDKNNLNQTPEARADQITEETVPKKHSTTKYA
ncbi:CPBP family intramembrane glutamic endopeptidase [Enterococcus sp. AZ163]|uniref:CPBP family intramembrane glutamic endopeptidase n=1 Tax=Enterococcus sp. AZ163 TaxID=2774638 RepID=UPI003D27EE05